MKHTQPSEQRMLRMAQNAPVGFWSWDIQTNKEWWSDGFYNLLKLDFETTKPSYDFWIDHIVHPSDKQAYENAVNEHIKHLKPYSLKIRLKVKDQWKWFETTGEADRDNDGKAVVMNGSIHDIDDLIKSNNRLKEQNEILNEISSIGSIGSWKIDLTANTVVWSEEVYRIHDAEVTFQPTLADGINFYLPEYREMVTEAVENAIQKNQMFRFEAKIQTLVGTIKWVKSVGKVVLDQTGKATSIVGLFQDVTREMENQIEKDNSFRIIEQQNDRLLNFAHIVSHNLRTHSGNMEMLHGIAKSVEGEKELREIIGMLDKASAGLSETIEHLNEVVAIQTNKDIPITSIPVKKQIESILDNINAQISSDNADIRLEISESHNVLFNRAYFDSVILNLVSNALKYKSEVRDPAIVISTNTWKQGLEITIQDNGRGIDLDQHGKKIFGLYKTFHESQDARGIGLFITKNQLDALGASISVESKVGLGSTFRIKFPN